MDISALKPFVELGALAVIALGVLVLLGVILDRVLRQSANREAALREEWARANKEIAEILNNHLSTIAENQAKTAALLELISTRLLDKLFSGR